MDEGTRHITENQCIVTLSGLICRYSGICAVYWSELVLANVSKARWKTKEESLSGDDIHSIDVAVIIHISSGQPAP